MEKIKKMNILEIWICIYFTIGAFAISNVMYLDSVMLMIIHIILIMYISKNSTSILERKLGFTYIMLLFSFGILIVSLFLTGSTIKLIIIRIIRIFAFIQIFLLYSINVDIINYKKIITNIVKIYYKIGTLVIIDALVFLVIKKSLWSPEVYLGYRFSGPFLDSNYLGAFYSVMLMLILYTDIIEKKYNTKYIIIFCINIMLSLSWSVIILCIFSLIITRFIKSKNIILKNILILVFYIILLLSIFYNLDEFKSVFIGILEKVLNMSYESAHLKYVSLEHRIVIQGNIFELLKENILGLGPKKIIEIFGRDSHNAYISFLGEMGIAGILVYILPLNIMYKKYNKVVDVISTFIILESMFINLLLTPIYWFLVFIMIWKYREEREILL